MDQYNDFAYVYDRLMEDVDYNNWVNYIQDIFKREDINPSRVLELACGTGNITMPLAERGYKVIGVDISQDMLMVAKDKALTEGLDVLLIQQDMTQLELEGEFDSILCMCDGINYIVEEEDLSNLFATLYNHLTEGGLLIFDISSHYKLKNVLGGHTFGENQGDLCYLWENYFDEDTNLLEMDLTFFIEDKNLFRKFEEFHLQRGYHVEEILKLLKASGFKSINVYDGFNFNKPEDESQRIFFVCKQ